MFDAAVDSADEVSVTRFDLIRVIDSYWLFFFAKLTTLMDWWKVKKKEQPIFCACVCMFRLVCSEQNGQKPIGRICLVSK